MQIVVNHLTKMDPGYICVAGIGIANHVHIRTTLARRLDDTLAKKYGGIIAIGEIVDLGVTINDGAPPEIEDQRFELNNIRVVRTMSATSFWKMLSDVAEPSLEEIFGKHLERAGKSSYAVAEGKGSASLGCLSLAKQPKLYIDSHQKLRISFDNDGVQVDVKVNDLRMHKRDGTILHNFTNAAISKVNRGHKVILTVGLARAFQAKNDNQRRHWLQVNNIHFADDPLWSSL